MEKLDFLNAGEPAPEDVPVIDAPVVDETPAAPQVDVVDAPAPVLDQQPPVQPIADKPVIPEGYVPLATVLDTRDKLKAEQDRTKHLEEQLRQFQQPAPDPDSDDYAAFSIQQTQAAVLSSKLDISEEMSREKFGDATVDAAKEWAVKRFAEDPSFHQQVLGQRNPYGFAVAQYQRTQALDKLGAVDPTSIDAFLAWQAAQGASSTTQPATTHVAAAPPIEQPVIPSRSLASAPGAGGSGAAPTVTVGAGEAYANMFGQTG